MDTSTGEYELTYHSKNKESIDAAELMKMLNRVLTSVTGQVDNRLKKETN
jgi:hypothetical protein